MVKYQAEFVAADPRYHVPGPQTCFQNTRDMEKHGVARLMTVAVVNRLEPVQVDEQHCRWCVMARGLVKDALKLPKKSTAIGKRQQGIGVGQPFKFLQPRPQVSERCLQPFIFIHQAPNRAAIQIFQFFSPLRYPATLALALTINCRHSANVTTITWFRALRFRNRPVRDLEPWGQVARHFTIMSESAPPVGIIMGSTSDWETMRHAADALDALGVAHEAKVVSAHRTPDRLFAYAKEAAGRGLKVIIAGAGGAAHLPGMAASMTILPVLGVPVESKALSGMDSLLSIVQMPGGIPVGTLAIGKAGATNAGLLAASILALSDPALAGRLDVWRKAQTDGVATDPA